MSKIIKGCFIYVKNVLYKKERTLSLLFLINIFLFYVPSFYIIPTLKYSFLTTQALGRVGLFIFFFLFSLIIRRRKDSSLINGLVLSLFIVQSLSILPSLSVESFLQSYKDVLIGYLVYFTSQKIKIDQRVFIRLLTYSLIFNFVFNGMIFFYSYFDDIFQELIYARYYDLLIADILRERLYSSSFYEAYIPFLLLKTEGGTILNNFLIIVDLLFAFVSNFRTKILMALSSLLGGLIRIRKNRLIYVGAIIFTFIASLGLLGINNSDLFIDRFNLLNNGEQVQTINSRFTQIKIGVEMGKKPLGVGLGNYYDYIPYKDKHSASLTKRDSIFETELNSAIHNNIASIFAESGVLALILFILISAYFLKKDLTFFIKYKNLTFKHACLIAFWSLYLYGLLNPPASGSYQIQFWFIRGLLENENTN